MMMTMRVCVADGGSRARRIQNGQIQRRVPRDTDLRLGVVVRLLAGPVVLGHPFAQHVSHAPSPQQVVGLRIRVFQAVLVHVLPVAVALVVIVPVAPHPSVVRDEGGPASKAACSSSRS